MKLIISLATLVWLTALTTPAQAGWLIADYQLNSSFTDNLGGPSMVGAGGILSPTGYTFRGGQLPDVAAVISPTDYSVELLVSLTPAGERKPRDVIKNQTENADPVKSGGLPGAQAPTGITPGVPTRLVLTRDGSTGAVTGYVDGSEAFTFLDSKDLAMFDNPNGLSRTFQLLWDHTSGDAPLAATVGSLEAVRLYDGALTADQVQSLSVGAPPPVRDLAAVPAPGNLLLGALGAAGLLLGGRRWRLAGAVRMG
ncbi:MAG TPA: hypothetical protein VGF55_27505 [Gemmataceae bacterium]